MRIAITLALLSIAPITAQAADKPAADKVDMVSGSNAVQWTQPPPSVPKGAQIAVLAGDPSKSGSYVLRLKLPANYSIPAHHHPTTENVTVISGTLHAGMGDKLDRRKDHALAPGGFVAMPAGMNHFAWTTSETVIQVNGEGPFEIEYANPADDPRKRTGA